VKQNLEFQILESEFQFDVFSTADFKKNLTGIIGIKNGIGIPQPMGVAEIGTKNWNSQPSAQKTEVAHLASCKRGHILYGN
jgi:hypothetical protein